MAKFLLVLGYILTAAGLASSIAGAVALVRHPGRLAWHVGLKGAAAGAILILVGLFLRVGLSRLGLIAIALAGLTVAVAAAGASVLAQVNGKTDKKEG